MGNSQVIESISIPVDSRHASSQPRLVEERANVLSEPFGKSVVVVLEELDVRASSQVLVFSKTSLQRQFISPRTPRALYYNDDVYIGFCQNGEVLEVSVADPQLGNVFYTLSQSADAPPEFLRQTDNCLICHGGSQTRNIPGHVLRSTYPDGSGQPILASGTYRTDHGTPLQHRWGGWYVTGRHGEQTHLGNRIYRGRPSEDGPVDDSGFNVTDLSDRIRTSAYLSPHSDLVALMVLEHQAGGHNVLTRAAFDTRMALHREDSLNRELKEPPGHRWDSTNTILQSSAEAMVKYFLLSGEASLTSPVSGTSRFARQFTVRGPRDTQGRSLRDLDLSTRLFRYPCSYLIYTASFDALPAELRDRFWQRMDDVLSGRETSPDFAHLSGDDRQALREILIATKPGLPEGWGVAAK
ncbi:MAG: hypothetical protein B7Z55_09345 [Planctomycetales bacterium 12-60-4]|nr:MAG: hypothetical protein B7Z55_09345 [Planctomycetales bacterium 12-60-4]